MDGSKPVDVSPELQNEIPENVKPAENENTREIAGYTATADPYKLLNYPHKRHLAELEKVSLAKLHSAGLDVTSLDEAHEQFHLSPLRTIQDLYKILGYQANPKGASGTAHRYREDHLTALAFQYPDLQKPGEALPHSQIIRVRPASPIVARDRNKQLKERKYEQPNQKPDESASRAEPYFLFQQDMWNRLYDKSQPLIITEGELKAISLGLAGFAAIAFGGCTVWRARGGAKNQLHDSLNPKFPASIPIVGRDVYLLPDVDFHSKQTVKSEFRALGRALYVAGANRPKIAFMQIPLRGEWKGIDDYLEIKLQQRWAGDNAKITEANLLIQAILENYEVITETSALNAVDPARCAERLLDKLSKPERYVTVLSEKTQSGTEDVGWGIYDNDHYRLSNITFTGGVSGKMTTPDKFFRSLVSNDYNEGLAIQAEEGGTPKGGPRGMPTDHPNSVLALLDHNLPRHGNNTLIEPFENVEENDKCLRIQGGLINLTKCFNSMVNWDERHTWLLPPDYRWFSIDSLNVSLSNLDTQPQCPMFLNLINNAFDGDLEKISCLRLWFGKILCSPLFVDRKQFLCFYGTADSGKSTITDALISMLGNTQVLSLRAGFSGRFDLGNAPGKKLLLFPETPDGENYQFDPYWADVIKGITGGDYLTIEKKRMNAVSVRLNTEVMTVGNWPPSMEMDRQAFISRAIFLSTTKAITDKNPIAKAKMLATELPGIFYWALQGAAHLYRGERIETPTACLVDMEETTSEVDVPSSFIRTQVKWAEDSIITSDRLLEVFHMWAVDNRYRTTTASKRKLGRLMREIHQRPSSTARVGKDVVRVYRGVTFASEVYRMD